MNTAFFGVALATFFVLPLLLIGPCDTYQECNGDNFPNVGGVYTGE